MSRPKRLGEHRLEVAGVHLEAPVERQAAAHPQCHDVEHLRQVALHSLGSAATAHRERPRKRLPPQHGAGYRQEHAEFRGDQASDDGTSRSPHQRQPKARLPKPRIGEPAGNPGGCCTGLDAPSMPKGQRRYRAGQRTQQALRHLDPVGNDLLVNRRTSRSLGRHPLLPRSAHALGHSRPIAHPAPPGFRKTPEHPPDAEGARRGSCRENRSQYSFPHSAHPPLTSRRRCTASTPTACIARAAANSSIPGRLSKNGARNPGLISEKMPTSTKGMMVTMRADNFA